MTRRLPIVLALLAVILIAAPRVTTPRESAVPPGSGPVVDASASSGKPTLGAPSIIPPSPRTVAEAEPSLAGTAAPHPTGGVGQPASVCKPGYCETPPPTVTRKAPTGHVATWYPRTRGYGDLATVALPDGHYIPAGRPVPYATVCVFVDHQARCGTFAIVDFCACGGNHIVDLSLGAVRALGLDPSSGIWPATVEELH